MRAVWQIMGAAGIFAIALSPVPAAAQLEEANGIKVGDGRLHPYLGLELRYDTAALYSDTNQLRAELIAHISPGLRFDLQGPAVTINLDGKVDYVRYTGWITPGSGSLSRLQAEASLAARYIKEGPFGVELSDQFSRLDRTTNVSLGAGILSLFNDVRLAVPIHPGGGAIEVTPSLAYTFERLSPISLQTVPGCTDPTCDPNLISGQNYQEVRPALEARWKFFPKTAFVLDTRMHFRTYASSANPSASLLKGMVGVAGLISARVAVVAKAGWGQDFTGSRGKTVLGQLELSYLLSDTNKLKIGYLHTLEPVSVFGSYADHRAYAETRLLLSGRLQLHASVGVDFLSFTNSPRNDTDFSVVVEPEYQVTKWFIVTVGYRLDLRSSNQATASLNFARHEPYLRLMFIY